MKSMSCKQLGGACDIIFHANTFEEIAELSKAHGIEMYQKSDNDHLEAMNKMQSLMSDPAAMAAWLENRKNEFDALPDD